MVQFSINRLECVSCSHWGLLLTRGERVRGTFTDMGAIAGAYEGYFSIDGKEVASRIPVYKVQDRGFSEREQHDLEVLRSIGFDPETLDVIG